MNFPSRYHVMLDCHRKIATFHLSNKPAFEFRGIKRNTDSSLVLALTAEHLLHKGCKGYLTLLIGLEKSKNKLEELPTVREFPDVFPDDVPGLPPRRAVDFLLILC